MQKASRFRVYVMLVLVCAIGIFSSYYGAQAQMNVPEVGRILSHLVDLEVKISQLAENIFVVGDENEANCIMNIYLTNAANNNWEGDYKLSLYIKDKEIRNEEITWESNLNKSAVVFSIEGDFCFFSFLAYVPAQKTRRFTIRYVEEDFVRNDTARYDFSYSASPLLESHSNIVIFKIPIKRPGFFNQFFYKLVYEQMSPIPTNIFREGTHDVLVWNDPLAIYFKETELGEVYRVEVSFHHDIDWVVMWAWIGGLLASSVGGYLLKWFLDYLRNRVKSETRGKGGAKKE